LKRFQLDSDAKLKRFQLDSDPKRFQSLFSWNFWPNYQSSSLIFLSLSLVRNNEGQD
jgi:hypothetical protein